MFRNRKIAKYLTPGKRVHLVGIGGEKIALDMVQNGGMTGTVTADLQGLAVQISATVHALLDEFPVEKQCYIDYIKIACKLY